MNILNNIICSLEMVNISPFFNISSEIRYSKEATKIIKSFKGEEKLSDSQKLARDYRNVTKDFYKGF